jgi:nitroreductase
MLDQELKTEEKSFEQLEKVRTETEDVILKRRSVRIYQKKQVPEFMIRRIIEAGRFAPSAGNCQPWKFVVIRDREMINEITEGAIKVCKKFKGLIEYRYTGSSLKRMIANFVIRLKPNDLHPVPFGAVSLIADEKLGLFHGAPTVVIILEDVRGIGNPSLDCGIVAQNMVLAAHSMGLGTCYIGFTKAALDASSALRKRLGIDYPYKFVTSLAIGFPVGNPDAMVPRPTHAVDWFEDGKKKTVY